MRPGGFRLQLHNFGIERFRGDVLNVGDLVGILLLIVRHDHLFASRERYVEDSEEFLLFSRHFIEDPPVFEAGHVDIVQLSQQLVVAVIVHAVLLLSVLRDCPLVVKLDPGAHHGLDVAGVHESELFSAPNPASSRLSYGAGHKTPVDSMRMTSGALSKNH